MKIRFIKDTKVKYRENMITDPDRKIKEEIFKKDTILEVHEIYEIKNKSRNTGYDELDYLVEVRPGSVKVDRMYKVRNKDYKVIEQ